MSLGLNGLSSWACLVKLPSWECHQITFDDKSTLVQGMVRCHQATSHYLNQYWPNFMMPNHNGTKIKTHFRIIKASNVEGKVLKENWFNTLTVDALAPSLIYKHILSSYRDYWWWVNHYNGKTVHGSQGAVSIRKTVLPGMAIPMLKIRRPNGRLIFNMEIAIRR